MSDKNAIMEHHSTHPVMAGILTVTSLIFSFFSAITLKDLQGPATFIAVCIAIISGCFAIRYHHLASVEKKLIIDEKKAALKREKNAS